MADGSEARATNGQMQSVGQIADGVFDGNRQAPTGDLAHNGPLDDKRWTGLGTFATATHFARNTLAAPLLATVLQDHADREGILAGQHEAEAQRYDALADAARLKHRHHLKIAEAYATAAHHLRGNVG